MIIKIANIDCCMAWPQLDGQFRFKTFYGLCLIQTHESMYTSCISHNFIMKLKQFGTNDSINYAFYKFSYLKQYKGKFTDMERHLVLGQLSFAGSDKRIIYEVDKVNGSNQEIVENTNFVFDLELI